MTGGRGGGRRRIRRRIRRRTRRAVVAPDAGHRRRRRHRRVRGGGARRSRAPSCRSTASSTSPRPTTSGRSTRATAASCGTTSGRRGAARTSATAASACGATTSSSRRRTTTSCRSTRETGKERWHVEIADFDQQYFSTMAPIVVDNHVLVGTGNDLDSPGFLQSFDPGDRQAAVEVLHRADESRRSRPRDVAEPRRGAARRRAGVDSRRRTIRRRSSTSSAPAIRRRATPALGAQGRQPLHLLARRGERRHRQDGLVLPDVAARHARLGLGADADPDRRHDRREAAQAGVDGGAQRLLLHARSRHRRARRDEQVPDRRRTGRLSQRPTGEVDPQSGQGSHDSRLARVAGRRRRDQLAAAGVLARTPACSTSRSTTASTCST